MAFVWSNWYIVMAVLAIGVIACIAVFILMDKKDKEIVADFVKKNSEPAPATKAEPAPVEKAIETPAEKSEPVAEVKEETAPVEEKSE